MRSLDDIESGHPDRGFQFPGVFEITALGRAGIGLERRVVDALAHLGLAVLAGSERRRDSKEGNYVSVSVSFTCPSRELYDQAHATLRADPDIRWTL